MSCPGCEQANADYLAAALEDRVVVKPCWCAALPLLKYTRQTPFAETEMTQEVAREMIDRYRKSAGAITSFWAIDFARAEAQLTAVRAARRRHTPRRKQRHRRMAPR